MGLVSNSAIAGFGTCLYYRRTIQGFRLMSIFSELKRRNVYRVAAIYIIVSWVVLQVVDTFMSFMPLPEWTSRLVFVLLAAGFPVALVLAWAMELTPEGIKLESSGESISASRQRRGDVVIYGGLSIVLIIWLWNLDWGQETPDLRGARDQVAGRTAT